MLACCDAIFTLCFLLLGNRRIVCTRVYSPPPLYTTLPFVVCTKVYSPAPRYTTLPFLVCTRVYSPPPLYTTPPFVVCTRVYSLVPSYTTPPFVVCTRVKSPAPLSSKLPLNSLRQEHTTCVLAALTESSTSKLRGAMYMPQCQL